MYDGESSRFIGASSRGSQSPGTAASSSSKFGRGTRINSVRDSPCQQGSMPGSTPGWDGHPSLSIPLSWKCRRRRFLRRSRNTSGRQVERFWDSHPLLVLGPCPLAGNSPIPWSTSGGPGHCCAKTQPTEARVTGEYVATRCAGGGIRRPEATRSLTHPEGEWHQIPFHSIVSKACCWNIAAPQAEGESNGQRIKPNQADPN